MAFTSAITSAYLSVSRWKLSMQPLSDKVIVIGVPHISDWDSVFMAISMWKSGCTLSLLVKDSIVKTPVLGWFVKKTGAVAVERSVSHGLVEQVAQYICGVDTFTLCITSKGTRSPRVFWEPDSYHIAMGVGVSIQLGLTDHNTRTFGWGLMYQLMDDVHADMETIRVSYADRVGIHPEKTSVPRLRVEDEAK